MNMLFSFQGRIGRLQYWLTTFGVIAFYVVVLMLLGVSMSVDSTTAKPSLSSAALLIVCGTMIIGMWINLAAMARRYHDRNKSGWWFFICLVPIIGALWQLIELGFLSGTPGGNDYGVRGQSSAGSSWSSDDEHAPAANNSNLDDLIQQRLIERQQQQSSVIERNTSMGGNSNPLAGERPVFGRRT